MDLQLSSAILASLLMLLAGYDARYFVLPNWLTASLAIVGGLVSAWRGHDDLLWNIVGAACGFFLVVGVNSAYRYARNRDGIGLGDAKLLAGAGMWVGPFGLPSVLLIASGAGLIAVLMLRLIGYRVTMTTRLPFGSFLCLGIWIVWLVGPLSWPVSEVGAW